MAVVQHGMGLKPCQAQLVEVPGDNNCAVTPVLTMVGVVQQGPCSDKFGRRITYFVSGGLFIATSLVCIFAPSIGVLVAFRALQGAAGELCCSGVVLVGSCVMKLTPVCPKDLLTRPTLAA
jgi:hypothetical protein